MLINANNQTYTTSTPGNYIVTVAYGGGCSAKSNTRKVIVNSLPTKPTITWTNNVLNSSYPSGNKWYRNDSFIIGATATIFPLPSFFTYSQCFKVKETDANGCSIFSDSACFFPGGLPIKYVGFTAFYTNGMVLLNWTTAMATSGYFEIEKSIDGVIFSAIASKQMSRNTRSVMDYTFNDKDFSPNKGVEANGTITFTKTVPVFLTQTTCKISLFPNPAHRMVSVIGLGIKEVIFTELAGKVVYKQPALSVETNINISHLAKGIYVVTCVLENGTTTVSKLLVQ